MPQESTYVVTTQAHNPALSLLPCSQWDKNVETKVKFVAAKEERIRNVLLNHCWFGVRYFGVVRNDPDPTSTSTTIGKTELFPI